MESTVQGFGVLGSRVVGCRIRGDRSYRFGTLPSKGPDGQSFNHRIYRLPEASGQRLIEGFDV